MADRTETSSNASEQQKGAPAANADQSSGSNAAGTGDNPQDGRDSGSSGESRPRGKTEDPETTL
jgi:hypothetical protein